MIQQSVLQELEKQKTKLATDQQKDKTNSNKVKSPVKRKSEFTNRSSKENDKKRSKFMHDDFGEDEKQLKKKDDKKERKKKNIKKKRIAKEKKQNVITVMIIKV